MPSPSIDIRIKCWTKFSPTTNKISNCLIERKVAYTYVHMYWNGKKTPIGYQTTNSLPSNTNSLPSLLSHANPQTHRPRNQEPCTASSLHPCRQTHNWPPSYKKMHSNRPPTPLNPIFTIKNTLSSVPARWLSYFVLQLRKKRRARLVCAGWKVTEAAVTSLVPIRTRCEMLHES